MNNWKDWDKQYRARFIAKRNSCTVGEQLADRDEEKEEQKLVREWDLLMRKFDEQDIELDLEFA